MELSIRDVPLPMMVESIDADMAAASERLPSCLRIDDVENERVFDGFDALIASFITFGSISCACLSPFTTSSTGVP